MSSEITQRLCIPHWAVKLFGKWINSGSIDVTKVLPLECYTNPMETIRTVKK